jgi:hypothetical protein
MAVCVNSCKVPTQVRCAGMRVPCAPFGGGFFPLPDSAFSLVIVFALYTAMECVSGWTIQVIKGPPHLSEGLLSQH